MGTIFLTLLVVIPLAIGIALDYWLKKKTNEVSMMRCYRIIGIFFIVVTIYSMILSYQVCGLSMSETYQNFQRNCLHASDSIGDTYAAFLILVVGISSVGFVLSRVSRTLFKWAIK